MKWKSFTPEELVALRNNPYALTASEKTVSFKLAFKEYMWQGLQAGKPADMLMREMGYDTAAFGMPRINGIAYHIRQEAQSPIGLHEGRQHLRNTKGLTEEEASMFAPSVSIHRLQAEVAYLRQEVEFLKKLILAEKVKGRSE